MKTDTIVFPLFFGGIGYLWYSVSRSMPWWAFWYFVALCVALVLVEVLVRKVLLPRGVSERFSILLELLFAAVVAAMALWFGSSIYPGHLR